eukprot:evm.model.scf_1201.1 EVM.evm.TU.scf_1201.1   scf_1201:9-626(-)
MNEVVASPEESLGGVRPIVDYRDGEAPGDCEENEDGMLRKRSARIQVLAERRVEMERRREEAELADLRQRRERERAKERRRRERERSRAMGEVGGGKVRGGDEARGDRRGGRAPPGWCPLECAVPKGYRAHRTVPNRNLAKVMECAGLIAAKRGPGRPRKVRPEELVGAEGGYGAMGQRGVAGVGGYLAQLTPQQVAQRRELLRLE